MLKGFKEFVLRGNFLDLAIGVVIGASFTSVVNSFVKGLVSPLIGLFTNTDNFSALSFTVNGSQFLIGDIISSLISFFLSVIVIYFLVILPMNTFMRKLKKQPEKLTKNCPECLSEIPVSAKRCSYCTQAVV